uniref:Uncharacterized protein n=1 Tax=Leersia perrieri TaxID=77586 RepID=A0A0D9X844_9ORYZ
MGQKPPSMTFPVGGGGCGGGRWRLGWIMIIPMILPQVMQLLPQAHCLCLLNLETGKNKMRLQSQETFQETFSNHTMRGNSNVIKLSMVYEVMRAS